MFKLMDENIIVRTSDGACIPKDERNRDYKEFLAWVAKGNTPLPAVPTDARPSASVDFANVQQSKHNFMRKH